MRRNYAGCAICDSTWGDVWAEIEGERVFFCCDVCVVQFRNLVEKIRSVTGWAHLESIEISGDRKGRACVARAGEQAFGAQFSFTPDGQLLRFEQVNVPRTAAQFRGGPEEDGG